MVDCHHRKCCGCRRWAEFVAEVYGDDGMTAYNLCERHHTMLTREAAGKGVVVMGEGAESGEHDGR
jgi:hypothetical protein